MKDSSEVIQIAIDGPVAAGKGAVARILAQRLGIVNVDTGAMYRVATLLAMTHGLDMRDEAGIVGLIDAAIIELRPPTKDEQDGRWNTVLLDGKDVSHEIRKKEIGGNVAKVASLPQVREIMVRKQQHIAESTSVVMEGRDIGTVVLPEATLKIYLDANLEVRAKRRWEERKKMGEMVEYDEMLAQIRDRDEMDMTRVTSPLMRLDEAVYIDSSEMSIDEVVLHIIDTLESVKQ